MRHNVLHLGADPDHTPPPPSSLPLFPGSYEQMMADNYATAIDVHEYPMYGDHHQLVQSPRQLALKELHRHMHSAQMWRRISIANMVGLVLLAIAVIVVAAHHHTREGIVVVSSSSSSGPSSSVRAVPVGGLLEPEKVVPAIASGAAPLAYRFTISGVLARYPTDGAPVPQLDAKIAQKAQCCCTYRENGKHAKEVHICATPDDNPAGGGGGLAFRLQQQQQQGDGGHLVVEATSKLIGAECTLTWF